MTYISCDNTSPLLLHDIDVGYIVCKDYLVGVATLLYRGYNKEM